MSSEGPPVVGTDESPGEVINLSDVVAATDGIDTAVGLIGLDGADRAVDALGLTGDSEVIVLEPADEAIAGKAPVEEAARTVYEL